MLQQAKDLEAQASSLEQEAAASDSTGPPPGPSTPSVQQEQVQQQQHESELDDPKDVKPTSYLWMRVLSCQPWSTWPSPISGQPS